MRGKVEDSDQFSGLPPEIARLQELVSLAPTDPDLRLRLAEKLLEYRRREEAVPQIRLAIILAPNNLEARKLLELALSGRLAPPGRESLQ